jgi:alpha-glucoside transport system substrate-binding protein
MEESMRSKRLWKVAALLLAFALLAAACGGTEDTTTTTAAGGEATTTTAAAGGEETTTTEAALSGEVEVVWVRGEDHPEGQALLQVLDAFEQQTGVTVNYQGLGDDLPTIVSTRVEGGDPPDVAILPQPGLLTDFAAKGALVPADQAVVDNLDANFAPVWKELATRDGTTYGVYFKAGNKSLVWYNTDIVDDLGITLPETWDDLVAVSQTLVDNGITPMSVAGADGWTLSDWFENAYVRVAGQEKYEQLTNHEIPWTDPTVKTTFEKLAEVIGNPDFINGGLDGALQTGFVAAIVNAFGADEQAAMMYGPGDLGSIAADEAGATPGESMKFFAFPSIEGSPGAVLGGGDVAVAMTDNPNAQALLEFLSTPEAAEVWIPLGGFTSPNQNADLSLYPDELSRTAADQVVNAQLFVFDLSDLVPSAFGSTTGAGIWGNLQTWLEDPANIDAVLAQLEAEAEAAQPMG